MLAAALPLATLHGLWVTPTVVLHARLGVAEPVPEVAAWQSAVSIAIGMLPVGLAGVALLRGFRLQGSLWWRPAVAAQTEEGPDSVQGQ